MTYLDWKVGDRVACIEDTFFVAGTEEVAPGPHPKKGSIYSIADLCVRSVETPDGPGELIFIRVDGIYCIYHVDCFRKVYPRKTDISIFTAMLVGNRVGVPA